MASRLGPTLAPTMPRAPALTADRKPSADHPGTVVVEAHPVDDRLVGGQPEEARARIPRLWPRRHRAHLDEAEAEAEQRIDRLPVLVETGGETDRVGQAKTTDRGLKAWMGDPGRRRHQTRAQGADGEPVRPFGLDVPQQRGDDGVIVGHRCLPNSNVARCLIVHASNALSPAAGSLQLSLVASYRLYQGITAGVTDEHTRSGRGPVR